MASDLEGVKPERQNMTNNGWESSKGLYLAGLLSQCSEQQQQISICNLMPNLGEETVREDKTIHGEAVWPEVETVLYKVNDNFYLYVHSLKLQVSILHKVMHCV